MDKPVYDFSSLGVEPVHSVKYFVSDILNYIEKLCDSCTTTDLQRHFLYRLADDVVHMPSYTFYECSPDKFDVRGVLEFLDVHHFYPVNEKENLIRFFFGNEE